MVCVQVTREAREDLQELDGAIRKLVFKAMLKLEIDPEQRGSPPGSRSDVNLIGFASWWSVTVVIGASIGSKMMEPSWWYGL